MLFKTVLSSHSCLYLMQIVFSDAWWVGTAEENPQENQLPMPQELNTTTVHKDYDYGYGAAYAGEL